MRMKSAVMSNVPPPPLPMVTSPPPESTQKSSTATISVPLSLFRVTGPVVQI